jgi:hypothetical protein
MTDEHPGVVDLDTAARMTGRTRKAIAHRVDRGQVRHVLRNGKRYVPVSELVRTELVAPGSGSRGAGEAPLGDNVGRRPTTPPSSPTLDVLALLREQIEANQRQAEEIGRMKAITAEVESLLLRSGQEHAEVNRLQEALLEQRARAATAEAQLEALRAIGQPRRRWLRS